MGPMPASAQIGDLDIAGELIASLADGVLTEDQLHAYFARHSTLLRRNIEQAQATTGQDDVDDIIRARWPRYLAAQDQILAAARRFAAVKDDVIGKVLHAYGDDIPRVVVVPCLGLFTAGGWADNLDGTYTVFVALERLTEDFAMEILLAHEIAHGISEVDVSTVLGGFYNEGHATYVSSVLYPGKPASAYFFDPEEDRYGRYLDWIATHREQIWEDAGKPFAVLDEVHKQYFTTSFSATPNIGYVIGFRYLAALGERLTLRDLRTFGMRVEENAAAFKAWVLEEELL